MICLTWSSLPLWLILVVVLVILVMFCYYSYKYIETHTTVVSVAPMVASTTPTSVIDPPDVVDTLLTIAFGAQLKAVEPFQIAFNRGDFDIFDGTSNSAVSTSIHFAVGDAIYIDHRIVGDEFTLSGHWYQVASPAVNEMLKLIGPLQSDVFGIEVHAIDTSATLVADVTACTIQPDVAVTELTSTSTTIDVPYLPVWLQGGTGLPDHTIANRSNRDAVLYSPPGTTFEGGNTWLRLAVGSSTHVVFDGRDKYYFQ